MRREDLFAAIGEVEESRLARSEHTSASNVTILEGKIMEQTATKRPRGRTIRNVLVAAVVVAMLAAVTLASAAPEAAREPYENVDAMMEAFFGINGYPHADGEIIWPENSVNCLIFPSFDRVELDTEMAQRLVEPYVYAVDGTLEMGGDLSMTLEACMYDPATGCGLLYYYVEDTPVVRYELQTNGGLWGGCMDGIVVNYPSNKFIDTARSTETKVYVVEYFVFAESLQDDVQALTQQANEMGLQDMLQEMLLGVKGEELTVRNFGSEESLAIPVDDCGGVEWITLGNEAICLSPVGILLDGEGLDMLTENGELLIDELVIRYADGSEYVIECEVGEVPVYNYGYAIRHEEELRYCLNRIVDVEQVVSVVVDGTEYFAD